MSLPNTDPAKSVASDAAAPAPVVAVKTVAADSNNNDAKAALPDAPIAKSTENAGAEPSAAAAGIAPFSTAPVKPAVERPMPTRRQRAEWYTLVAVGHSAAVFDAWSTRNAVSQHYGTESDPFLRPFAHSNSLYAATQVSPLVMDYLGRRFMTSSHPMLRKFWWVPQVAGASFSFSAGAHNYALTR